MLGSIATALPALEFIVHAGDQILNVAAAETHEIIFGEYRPVRREHPFGAAAERPALTAGRKVADLRAGEVEYGRVGTGPGPVVPSPPSNDAEFTNGLFD